MITSFIMFVVGAGIGVLMCWVRMREKYLDLQAEFEFIRKEHERVVMESTEIVALVDELEKRRNPWI